MSLLLDTHILIWLVNQDPPGASRLTPAILDEMRSSGVEVYFSAASIWEVAVKFGRQKADFTLSPTDFKRNLLAERYGELSITSDHAAADADLPPIHRDPFDRILVAQALVEGLTLITADAVIARYPEPIRLV